MQRGLRRLHPLSPSGARLVAGPSSLQSLLRRPGGDGDREVTLSLRPSTMRCHGTLSKAGSESCCPGSPQPAAGAGSRSRIRPPPRTPCPHGGPASVPLSQRWASTRRGTCFRADVGLVFRTPGGVRAVRCPQLPAGLGDEGLVGRATALLGPQVVGGRRGAACPLGRPLMPFVFTEEMGAFLKERTSVLSFTWELAGSGLKTPTWLLRTLSVGL